MARITVLEAQSWVEATKFKISPNQSSFSAQDAALLEQLEAEVLARIAPAYDVATQATWTNSTTTPTLVKVIIAKTFVAWAYRRQYSEDLSDGDAAYALKLEANAETLILGLIDGSIEIPTETSNAGYPTFYPTDASSASEPTTDDPSLGPAKFSMNSVF